MENGMKATLRCHAYVSRSVHRGTAATSTTPRLILSVLGWGLSRRMVISYSRPFCPRRSSLRHRVQWKSIGCERVWLYTGGPPNRLLFSKPRMRWRMTWNDMKCGAKLQKRENPKTPDIVHHSETRTQKGQTSGLTALMPGRLLVQ